MIFASFQNKKKPPTFPPEVEELDDFGEYHFRSIHETEIHMLLGIKPLVGCEDQMDHYEETLRKSIVLKVGDVCLEFVRF